MTVFSQDRVSHQINSLATPGPGTYLLPSDFGQIGAPITPRRNYAEEMSMTDYSGQGFQRAPVSEM